MSREVKSWGTKTRGAQEAENGKERHDHFTEDHFFSPIFKISFGVILKFLPKFVLLFGLILKP